jgi:hypothetical protein
MTTAEVRAAQQVVHQHLQQVSDIIHELVAELGTQRNTVRVMEEKIVELCREVARAEEAHEG